MNADGNEKKELPELSRRVHNVNEKFMDGGVGEGQDLLEEDELRISRIAEDVKDGCDVANHAQVISQVPQQQQPQGSMVCWERFLHLRSLTVLLVENDDSTRHVVAALLRNCSYEVMEAANGLQAWKILEDLTKHIDLVLTEVVMPCLSGIGLLCKIMSHKTRKNIPVIMMSSHDSMGIVFKCLSKGAVDFLVKPIRKNELKNLWQHVWRRCHSSSGSGSESGSQIQKSVKSKRIEKSDNNTVSNDEDDNGSIGLNVGDGSDNGSGTQSSWTRRAVEVDSPQPASPSVQIAECPDSTCAQVIHSNAETVVNKWVPITATRRCHEQEELENVAMGKDLEIGVPRDMDLQLEYSNESAIQLIGTKQNNLPEIGSSKFSEQIDGGLLGLNYESPSNKLICKATNLIGVITNTTDLQMDSTEFESPNKLSMISEIDKAINVSKELPSLELSLKRLRGIKDIGTTVQDDRNVLRRSYLSAFSRYSTASSADKGSSKNIGTNSPLNNSLEVVKKEPVRNIQSHSNCNAPNRCSNEGSNNIDMGSTTNIAFTKPVVLRNKSATTSTVKSLHPSSTFQSIKIDHACDPQLVILDKTGDLITTAGPAQPRGPQVQHLHHHHHYDHHHHHHLVQTMQQQKLPPDHDDLSMKKMAAAVPHCGSSNALGGPSEGIAGNYSLNRSASGSNHGSNGQNGSSTAVNAGGMNIEGDNGLAGRSGSGDASGSGNGNRVDQNKFAQREAALTKFRQKRKERCFRQKVRYQCRKRLGEQRPHVWGQFVRQIGHENTSRTTES